jgi:hypothetical protein
MGSSGEVECLAAGASSFEEVRRFDNPELHNPGYSMDPFSFTTISSVRRIA